MFLHERDLRSEKFAFDALRLDDPVVKECDLIHEFDGLKVPEGIFRDPVDNDRNISVEVKRIIGIDLPTCGGGRRKILRRVNRNERIIWPWTSSVHLAISKLHPRIAQVYNVHSHHVVFIIPVSLTDSVKRRTIQHIKRVTTSFLQSYTPVRRTRLHIVEGMDELFDRY